MRRRVSGGGGGGGGGYSGGHEAGPAAAASAGATAAVAGRVGAPARSPPPDTESEISVGDREFSLEWSPVDPIEDPLQDVYDIHNRTGLSVLSLDAASTATPRGAAGVDEATALTAASAAAAAAIANASLAKVARDRPRPGVSPAAARTPGVGAAQQPLTAGRRPQRMAINTPDEEGHLPPTPAVPVLVDAPSVGRLAAGPGGVPAMASLLNVSISAASQASTVSAQGAPAVASRPSPGWTLDRPRGAGRPAGGATVTASPGLPQLPEDVSLLLSPPAALRVTNAAAPAAGDGDTLSYRQVEAHPRFDLIAERSPFVVQRAQATATNGPAAVAPKLTDIFSPQTQERMWYSPMRSFLSPLRANMRARPLDAPLDLRAGLDLGEQLDAQSDLSQALSRLSEISPPNNLSVVLNTTHGTNGLDDAPSIAALSEAGTDVHAPGVHDAPSIAAISDAGTDAESDMPRAVSPAAAAAASGAGAFATPTAPTTPTVDALEVFTRTATLTQRQMETSLDRQSHTSRASSTSRPRGPALTARDLRTDQRHRTGARPAAEVTPAPSVAGSDANVLDGLALEYHDDASIAAVAAAFSAKRPQQHAALSAVPSPAPSAGASKGPASGDAAARSGRGSAAPVEGAALPMPAQTLTWSWAAAAPNLAQTAGPIELPTLPSPSASPAPARTRRPLQHDTGSPITENGSVVDGAGGNDCHNDDVVEAGRPTVLDEIMQHGASAPGEDMTPDAETGSGYGAHRAGCMLPGLERSG